MIRRNLVIIMTLGISISFGNILGLLFLHGQSLSRFGETLEELVIANQIHELHVQTKVIQQEALSVLMLEHLLEELPAEQLNDTLEEIESERAELTDSLQETQALLASLSRPRSLREEEYQTWLESNTEFINLVDAYFSEATVDSTAIGVIEFKEALEIREGDLAEQENIITDRNLAYIENHRTVLARYNRTALIAAVIVVPLITILAVAFVWVIQTSFFQTLIALQKAATKIAQGDFKTRVPIKHIDELGLVSQAFNEMANQLEERTQSLINLNQTLEARIQERTKDLMETNEQLAEANKIKNQFLATMSHELRTPMNAVLGYAGLLLMGLMGELTAKQQEMVQNIQQSGEHLLGLINDVLNITRIEAGKVELFYSPIPLSDLIKDCRRFGSILADRKEIKFDASVDPSMPRMVYGDKERLIQIMNNLTSNAIKFTEKGQVTVSIRSSEPTSYQIIVADTGIGIPSEAHEYIFESFRQVDSSTTRSYGGTGLGLSIVKRLIEAMQGTITLTSEVGVGTTFIVTLPLHTEPSHLNQK